MGKINYSSLKIDCVRCGVVRDRQKNKPGEGFNYVYIYLYLYFILPLPIVPSGIDLGL